MVVLAVSVCHPDFDQMLVDAIHAAFQAVGRRHRGVAAVAASCRKDCRPVRQIDCFGYAFYPLLNPRFMGENPIRMNPGRAG